MSGHSGNHADHQRLLAAIGRALGTAGPYQESPPPAGAAGPPGRSVIAGTIDEGTQRVAWVERIIRGPGTGYPADQLMINIVGDEPRAWRTSLYSYNPYFGCDVHLIKFFGAMLAIVYTEKHGPRVARITPARGENRNIRIGSYFAVNDDLLAHTDGYQHVVHHLSLAEIAPAVPLPIPPPAGDPHRIELGVGQGAVRWADLVLRGEPRTRNWQVQRRGLLRLPDPGQSGFPADREALWARLRELLDAADAPADGPDILVATAGLQFWLPSDSWAGTERVIPPLWWFAATYYLFLRKKAPDQAVRWLAWLDRVAAGHGVIPPGWDPAWSQLEGAAQLALAHIRVRAAQLAQSCHDRALPYPFRNALAPGWARDKWVERAPLTDFPGAFVRAWERVPPRFFPGGRSSGH